MCIKITVTCNEPHTKLVKILDDIPVTGCYSRHSYYDTDRATYGRVNYILFRMTTDTCGQGSLIHAWLMNHLKRLLRYFEPFKSNDFL